MRQLEKLLIIGASFVIVVAGMRAASAIVVPFFLAVFVAIIASPLYISLRHRGVSTVTSLLLLMLALGAAGFVGVNLIGTSVKEFTRSIPEYQSALAEQKVHLVAWLEARGVPQAAAAVNEQLDPRSLLRYAGNLAAAVSALLGQAFLILIIVVFILLEVAILPGKIRNLPGLTEATWQGLEHVVSDVRTYMGIKTLMSMLTGFCIWAGARFMELDHAVMLGLLAFVLNYVPSVGSIIASLPGILVALTQFGVGRAVVCAIFYVVVNVGISNFLEPKFMGRGLGLSPLFIIISLIFWGWVLGPIGMLLSVPLTMAAKIALQSNEETRWLALLLGSNPKIVPPLIPKDSPSQPPPH